MKTLILTLILTSTASYAQNRSHNEFERGYRIGYNDGKKSCELATAKEAWLCTLETNQGEVIAKTGITRAAALLKFADDDLADMDKVSCQKL